MKTAIERSGFVPKAREVKTDVSPNLRLSSGKIDERAKWIRKWTKERVGVCGLAEARHTIRTQEL
jgi:hypothetical protein